MTYAVVDYERMKRLEPPPKTNIPMNFNTFCVFIIFIVILVLYRRYIVVKQNRERYHT